MKKNFSYKETEKVMDMFSKELQILDRNTVKYMIDEFQEQLDDAKEELASKDKYIAELEAKLKKQK